LHCPQDAGTRLGIRNTANRCRTAEELFEFALRKVSWRNGSRVVGAASNDAEDDDEIASMEGLNGWRSRNRVGQLRRPLGLASERCGKRKIGGNVEVIGLNGQRLFEGCLRVGKLSCDGLGNAEAIVGRAGVDTRRSFGERGEAFFSGALARQRRAKAKQRIGIVRILGERGAIRLDRPIKLVGTQISIAETDIRSRRVSRQVDSLAIELQSSFAAAVRLDIACEVDEFLRSVRAAGLLTFYRGFWKTFAKGFWKSATGESRQEHDGRE
jgi:hypothetical protein